MKLEFDLEKESLRLKRDFGIAIPKSDLLEEFNKYYSERMNGGYFSISISSDTKSIIEFLTIRQENVIGTGILQSPSLTIDMKVNDYYKILEENQDNYTLAGRWIADRENKTKPKLISVHIIQKREEV
jgi:hypothetical protein